MLEEVSEWALSRTAAVAHLELRLQFAFPSSRSWLWILPECLWGSFPHMHEGCIFSSQRYCDSTGIRCLIILLSHLDSCETLAWLCRGPALMSEATWVSDRVQAEGQGGRRSWGTALPWHTRSSTVKRTHTVALRRGHHQLPVGLLLRPEITLCCVGSSIRTTSDQNLTLEEQFAENLVVYQNIHFTKCQKVRHLTWDESSILPTCLLGRQISCSQPCDTGWFLK